MMLWQIRRVPAPTGPADRQGYLRNQGDIHVALDTTYFNLRKLGISSPTASTWPGTPIHIVNSVIQLQYF